jgi:hypothetical protein
LLLKGIVQQKLTGVENTISQKVFLKAVAAENIIKVRFPSCAMKKTFQQMAGTSTSIWI